MMQFVGLRKHQCHSILLKCFPNNIMKIGTQPKTSQRTTFHAVYPSISVHKNSRIKPLPKEKSNIIYEKYHLSVAIEMKCVSIESDDWARNAEQLLSLIVSKTIACVNKMRVNRLTKRIRDVDKISKCLILKSIPFLVGFAECQPYFRRCNYLGFRITYAKIALLCIYSCVCVFGFARKQQNPSRVDKFDSIPANWGITLKFPNKLNEFQDVFEIWAHMCSDRIHATTPNHDTCSRSSYHMSGEHLNLKIYELKHAPTD